MHGRGDDFYTPEMAYAERELDARIDYAPLPFRGPRVAEHELADAVDLLVGDRPGVPLQPVLELIDRGQLTWREVVEGLATGRMDHRVAAAFDSLAKVPPASEQELIDIGVLPAPPGAEPAQDTADEPRPRGDENFTSGFYGSGGDDDEWSGPSNSWWRN